MKTTACALDCYDACKIVFNDGKLSGDKTHPVGDGSLCSLINRSIENEKRIEKPTIDGKEVSMSEALNAVVEAFKEDSSLLWRGSGNMGVMQEVTNLFMHKIEATLTKGSLCDGAGDAGIELGRGVNRILPLEQIKNADTVVVWGRNITVTNAHIMPYLEGKEVVVIDPVETAIAKKANFHLQIKPRTDFYIATILARFLFMEDVQDEEWLEEFAPEYEDFYDFTREFRIKPILEYCETDIGEMGQILNYLRDKKVVFLVGLGVQKYSTGASTLQAIDALAATLGLFGKEGCGVHYLSNSKLGFHNPFKVNCKEVPKATVEFSNFKTVLVQGGNPAESMPNSLKVQNELKSVENLIYFGLYENETSKRANIVIPAKNFFEKEDVRLSYGHQFVNKMDTVKESTIGISEYDFTKYLFDAFNFDGLKSEKDYVDSWLNQCKKDKEGNYLSPTYEPLPYSNGFGKNGDDEFEFIDEYDDDFINLKQFKKIRTSSKNRDTDEKFWLITPKSKNSLNTQFKRENRVTLNPELGFKEGEAIRVSSPYGSIKLEAHLSTSIRKDCVLITNNTIGVNNLTPPILSNEGNNACYQEVKVEVESIV